MKLRLIDAEAFEKQVVAMAIMNGYALQKVNAFCELINKQPTAYEVDKVINELKRDKFIDSECVLSDVHQGYNAGLNKAIEIVKRGGVE